MSQPEPSSLSAVVTVLVVTALNLLPWWFVRLSQRHLDNSPSACSRRRQEFIDGIRRRNAAHGFRVYEEASNKT